MWHLIVFHYEGLMLEPLLSVFDSYDCGERKATLAITKSNVALIYKSTFPTQKGSANILNGDE